MPGWLSGIIKFLLPFLIDIVITTGLPGLAAWIMKKLPFIKKEWMDAIIRIVTDAINGIQIVKYDETLTKDAKKAQIRAIKRQARRDCVGTACVSETKSLE